jgi:hypothetical protein
MTIHWITTESDDVFAALEAVERAVTAGDHGVAPPAPAASGSNAEYDSYLAESLGAAHATWAIDQQAIVVSSRPGLAAAINAFQRLFRRLTWWHTLPQWQQATTFHGAVVRVIDVLLDRQRLLGIRIGQLESANTKAHIFALEQQIQALRDEQRELRRRIAELEQATEGNGR